MTCWASTGRPAGMRCSVQLVLARIIEPVSKLDSLRVLEEAGVGAASYPTLHAPPAGLCEGFLAAADLGGLRGARPAGPGDPGAL